MGWVGYDRDRDRIDFAARERFSKPGEELINTVEAKVGHFRL